MSQKAKVNFEKPQIFQLEEEPEFLTASVHNRKVLSELRKGQKFCFTGTWGTAMAFYSWLKKQVQDRYPFADYASSRIQREKLNALTENLFLPIKNHEPNLTKAPGNPWLKEFYPEEKEFMLRFTDYLGMNGARQWYEKGIQFPGLNHKVHPFYGTYFPTRTEHLELFDNWLHSKKDFRNAVDMGAGCGVLTFYMLKYGIKNITATDINPNSLYSLTQDLERTGMQNRVKLIQTSFFDGLENVQPDLVVFNPPWIPMETHTSIDKAMYYETGFFEEFFKHAYEMISGNCSLVILFSTFAMAAGISQQQPVEQELQTGSRFSLIEKINKKIHQKAAPRKDWLSQIRLHEEAELWVLRKTN
jgi:methylase of polypeptide subunit release factors